MTLPRSSRLARLTRTALPAAPLVFTALPSARATIIYTDLGAGVSASGAFSPIYFDLDHSGPGNGTNGFASTTSLSGADFELLFNQTSPNRLRVDSLFLNNQAFASESGGYAPAYALSAPITGDILSDASYLTRSGAFSLTPPWTSGTTAYLGVFISDGASNFYYGWALVNYTGTTVTLFGFAYNNVLNGGINAGEGATAIPEPSAAPLATGLAALLAGSATLYRRRVQKKSAPLARRAT